MIYMYHSSSLQLNSASSGKNSINLLYIIQWNKKQIILLYTLFLWEEPIVHRSLQYERFTL